MQQLKGNLNSKSVPNHERLFKFVIMYKCPELRYKAACKA